jgi:hypothetical protein
MLFVITYVTYVLQLCAIPLAGGLAVFKGDKPERYGAIILLVPVLLEDVVLPVSTHLGYHLHNVMPYVELASTFMVSSGFLYIAVRYASLWLAAAMVVQGTELYFTRAFIDSGVNSGPANFNLYGTEVNTITILVLGILGGAAVVSWRARAQKQHLEAKRAELVVERERARDQKFREMFESRPAPLPVPARTHRGVARLTIEPPPL